MHGLWRIKLLVRQSKIPVREEEELEEEKEEPNEEKVEDPGKIPSLDTLDLLSFFRREKEEAEKSTEKGDTEGKKVAGSPDPRALLKRAANAKIFFGGEGEVSSASPVPIVEEPKSILKKAHESSYQGRSEQNDDKSINIVGVEGEVSSTSPVPKVDEPKSIPKKSHESNDGEGINIVGGESEVSSTSPVPTVEEPKSILTKAHESSYTKDLDNHDESIAIEAGSDLKTDNRGNNTQST